MQAPAEPSTDENKAKLLRNWKALNDQLRTETDWTALLPLLRYAVENEVREQVVQRLYGRISVLREASERAALGSGVVPVTLR